MYKEKCNSRPAFIQNHAVGWFTNFPFRKQAYKRTSMTFTTHPPLVYFISFLKVQIKKTLSLFFSCYKPNAYTLYLNVLRKRSQPGKHPWCECSYTCAPLNKCVKKYTYNRTWLSYYYACSVVLQPMSISFT